MLSHISTFPACPSWPKGLVLDLCHWEQLEHWYWMLPVLQPSLGINHLFNSFTSWFRSSQMIQVTLMWRLKIPCSNLIWITVSQFMCSARDHWFFSTVSWSTCVLCVFYRACWLLCFPRDRFIVAFFFVRYHASVLVIPVRFNCMLFSLRVSECYFCVALSTEVSECRRLSLSWCIDLSFWNLSYSFWVCSYVRGNECVFIHVSLFSRVKHAFKVELSVPNEVWGMIFITEIEW